MLLEAALKGRSSSWPQEAQFEGWGAGFAFAGQPKAAVPTYSFSFSRHVFSLSPACSSAKRDGLHFREARL
jgi:hypothetical protein